MPGQIQFGKRHDQSAASAAARRKPHVFKMLAFIAALVPGYFVGSWVGGEAVGRFLGDRSGGPSLPSSAEFDQKFRDEVHRLLADQAAAGHTPGLDEALRMVNNLPSTFADVSRRLESARQKSNYRSVGDNRLPEDRSVNWHKPGLADIQKMAVNAQSQFEDVNRILGIRSNNKNPQSQFAGVSRLMEILSADMSKLSPLEKAQMIEDANTQTAVVFRRFLPMAAISGMTLFAIDPAGTTLRYSYRTDESQTGLDKSQVGNQLMRQVCQQILTRQLMRHGGGYEFHLYDSDDQLIDQFTISESSCS